MLLLCKKCNVILYYIDNNIYKTKNMAFNQEKIENCIILNNYCIGCYNFIGMTSFKICKECLLKKNIVDEKNFLFFYYWYDMTFFRDCYFCEKKFFTVNCLNKNIYTFKNI